MRVAIVGGTGFVGSYICEAVAAAGHDLVLLVREGSEGKAEQARHARLVTGDLSSRDSLDDLVSGCDAVIYNVGILRESRRDGITFEAMQFEGARNTVDAARGAGVRRLLLMSANGVKEPGTPYQETKHRAERYALESGLRVTVFRPSVIFGDPRGRMEFATQLFNQMIRPPLPAVAFYAGTNPGRGAVLMSPVAVEDVAQAFAVALDDDATIGKTFELGGPEVLSWRQIVKRIAAAAGRRKTILPMPIALMKLNAALFDRLPFFPVTRDQLAMLEEGNTANPAVLEQLIGTKPKPFTPEALSYISG